MRLEKSFAIPKEQRSLFAEKALQWGLQQEEYLSYLTSCGISYPYGAFPHLMAIGALVAADLCPELNSSYKYSNPAFNRIANIGNSRKMVTICQSYSFGLSAPKI